jgi:hypothetical protein
MILVAVVTEGWLPIFPPFLRGESAVFSSAYVAFRIARQANERKNIS